MPSENARGELVEQLPRHNRSAEDPSEASAMNRRKTTTTEESRASRFAELFDEHADAIFNYCYRRTANRSDAEDLLSAVFLAAWRNRRRMPAGRELPWLYGIATNVIRNHRRTQWRLERLRLRLAREPDPSAGGEETHDGQLELLLHGLDKLRPAERDAFILCAWQGLSYEDTARALGVPVGTVRSTLSRARQKLRELSREAGHECLVAPTSRRS